MEAHAEMNRLWAERWNGGVAFTDIFGVTLRLPKQKGNWLERETVGDREDNTYKGEGS